MTIVQDSEISWFLGFLCFLVFSLKIRFYLIFWFWVCFWFFILNNNPRARCLFSRGGAPRRSRACRALPRFCLRGPPPEAGKRPDELPAVDDGAPRRRTSCHKCPIARGSAARAGPTSGGQIVNPEAGCSASYNGAYVARQAAPPDADCHAPGNAT